MTPYWPEVNHYIINYIGHIGSILRLDKALLVDKYQPIHTMGGILLCSDNTVT